MFLLSVTKRHYTLPSYDQFMTPCQKIDDRFILTRQTVMYEQILTSTSTQTTKYSKQSTSMIELIPDDEPINDSNVGGEVNTGNICLLMYFGDGLHTL